jgi:hypothetical protein
LANLWSSALRASVGWSNPPGPASVAAVGREDGARQGGR